MKLPSYEQRYRARIGEGRARISLGTFDTAYEAARARAKARGAFFPAEPEQAFTEIVNKYRHVKRESNDETCAALRRAITENTHG